MFECILDIACGVYMIYILSIFNQIIHDLYPFSCCLKMMYACIFFRKLMEKHHCDNTKTLPRHIGFYLLRLHSSLIKPCIMINVKWKTCSIHEKKHYRTLTLAKVLILQTFFTFSMCKNKQSPMCVCYKELLIIC